jgi:alginate O-acetyltransferase complex protein AlgI
MLFNSISFLLFFLVVYSGYLLLGHRKQNYFLLFASYAFYATWNILFLFLIIASTVINYCCGLMIRDGKIHGKGRFVVTTWLVISGVLFVLVPSASIFKLDPQIFKVLSWDELTSWNNGWLIFLTICAVTGVLNIFYPMLTKLIEVKRKRFFLFMGVLANLSFLGYFKYSNFFLENVEQILRDFNLNLVNLHLDIVLPIGISFFTFKGISYLVDIYRGDFEPEYKYSRFGLYIAFFPALLAGPIDRAGNLLKQINGIRKLTTEKSLRGLHLIFYGLFKKVVIADGLVRTVNSVFSASGHPSWIDVIVATLFFTLQIYCDFSGYTDMARGTAKLLGFDLMVNFNLPYFSRNPREFWARWHISLSTWLRDYLYIPLGGNRYGTKKTYKNLMVTMILGGLWHGAAWNFILWGFYHGILLCLHRDFQGVRKAVEARAGFFVSVLKTLTFFAATCYGWLLFRSPTLESVLTLSSTLILDFGNLDFGAARPRFAVLFALPIFMIIELIEYASNGKSFYKTLPIPLWTAIYASIIFTFIIGFGTESAQFIYFNF